MSKKLADLWKSLPEDQKQMYVEQSRIESEIMSPVLSSGLSHKKETSPTERLAYSNFAAIMRRDKPGEGTSSRSLVGFSEANLREIIDQKWGSMSQSERLKYVSSLTDTSDGDQKQNMGMMEEHNFTENN